ncbi:MAG TPA: hypothetical protein VK821_10440, partial [Dehalococcoidia bacterium]|nr:hypothetical protein [Dehalococcoidia bacterium]
MIKNGYVSSAIARLHESPIMAYVVCTGAGAGLTKLLWSVASCSRTLIASEFPYDPRAVANLIGRVPKQYCSPGAAAALAAAGYLKAQRCLVEQGKVATPIVSLGLTAAVSTDRTRRGEDKVFLAIRTGTGLATVSAVFPRARFSREEEGAICDLLGLNCLLWAAGIDQTPIAWIGARHALSLRSAEVSTDGMVRPAPVVVDLGEKPLPVLVDPDGGLANPSQLSPAQHIIFPGSFNPLHFGHDLCAQLVVAMTGKQVVFELAAANADKPGIDRAALAARAFQFRGRWPVLVSEGLPLFIDKARAYGGFSFILGLDTAVRLFEPKYFGGEAGRDAAVAELRELGTTFYVCNRGEDPLALTTLILDPRFAGLFVPVPVLVPVSSSDIR